MHITAAALALLSGALPISTAQADQTISGNLSVTGNTDIDGSNLTFGTQSSTYGAGLLYNNADTDTLTYQLTRSTASWLWAHNSSTSAMRLNGSHELILYKSDGSTAGVTITPASSTLSLGGSTLYRDGSGVLTTNSGLSVGGAFSATTFAASSGTLTGGSSGLTINAGGSGSQNITLNPTGSGNTILNGNVGIGTSSPGAKLHVAGTLLTTRLDVNEGSTGEFRADSINVRYGALGDSTDAVMFSQGNAGIAIDVNGNSTSNFFSIFKDNFYRSGGTELFRVQENGDAKASGNLVEKYLAFTPTTVGWYRIASSSNETDGGIIRIFNRGYDGTKTDVEFQYNIGGYSNGGSIQQTRYSSYQGGTVNQVRISSHGGSTYVDIYISTAASPEPIFLYGYGPNFGGFVSSPSVGATAGPSYSTTLALGHGVRTSSELAASSISANTSVLVDPSAGSLYGAHYSTLVDDGSWTYVSQHAGRDIAVWNWKAGGSPTVTSMQLKASKDDTNNPAQLALYNASGSTKVLLNTGGTSHFMGGNVGIGTTTASAKLAVAGDVKVSGAVLVPAQGDLPMGSFTSGPQPTL